MSTTCSPSDAAYAVQRRYKEPVEVAIAKADVDGNYIA